MVTTGSQSSYSGTGGQLNCRYEPDGVKFEDYEAHGVAEYWLVDPDARFVEQYVRDDDGFRLVLKSGSGEVTSATSATIAGFSVPIRAVFDSSENLVTLRRLLAPEGNPAKNAPQR